jgi:hypothetical protein
MDTNDFLKIQNTINKNKIFDMEIIKNQASNDELLYFNKNGYWYWSDDTIKLYEHAIEKNPYIRTLPSEATKYARTIYNEKAILEILSNQTTKGRFLLNGVRIKGDAFPSGYGNFPFTSGLAEENDLIICNGNTLERIKANTFDLLTENVNYNILEKIIPGFKFENNPCNPCDKQCNFSFQ